MFEKMLEMPYSIDTQAYAPSLSGTPTVFKSTNNINYKKNFVCFFLFFFLSFIKSTYLAYY